VKNNKPNFTIRLSSIDRSRIERIFNCKVINFVEACLVLSMKYPVIKNLILKTIKKER